MRPARLKAFTLVELMVATGIVAALAAILLPVTRRAREAGKRTACQSGLRQLAAAVQQYNQDNDGRYPLAQSWQQAISPYLKNAPFRCPTRDAATSLGDEDYTFNAMRLNTFLPKRPQATSYGTHEAILMNTATIWLHVDGARLTADGVCHGCRIVPKTSCGRQFIGSILHAGGGNYSFVDGHVQWLVPEAMGEGECRNGPLPFPFRD